MVTRFKYWFWSETLFGAVKLTKNADPDKYSYSGYGIGFNSCSLFSINATKIYQFKAKDSERKIYPLCLEKISRVFAFNNMKKLGLNGHLNKFYVDYSIIIYWKNMIINNA